MKFQAGSTWVTHLLALLAGVGIYQGFRTHAPGGKPPETMAQAGPAVAKSPAETEVMQRLADSREAERRRLEESAKEESAREDAPPGPVVTVSLAQRLLEIRKTEIPEHREELEALVKRAKDYEKIADLRVPLKEAMLGNEDRDAAIAIFIEWHRRDPAAAFDELAARTKWSNTVLRNSAMMMFLKPEEILAQMDARNRSADFREMMVNELASHLVNTDDLQGLSSYYAKLDPAWAEALMSEFVESGWVPRDGAAALAFVANRMEEPCRKALITKLADASPDDPSREWSDGIAAPLFRETLGAEQVAASRQMADILASQSGGGCCGGFGGDGGPADLALVEKAMQEKTPEAFDQAVGVMLLHDKDYPELFASGKITGDQALQDMMAALPGSEGHEDDVRRSIYREFAAWNPRAAVEWASGHLTDEELQSVAVEYNRYSADPRALHLLDLMEALPSEFSGGKFHGGLPLALYTALDGWRVLDPDAAEEAMNRFPETIDLAERLKIKPEERDTDPALLPPLEEESEEPTPSPAP